jgi:hypothetical protein
VSLNVLKYTNLPIPQIIFLAIDQVLGNELRTYNKSLIIISPILNTPIFEASGSPWTNITPSPVSQGETENGNSSPDPFPTGKRVKQKKIDKGQALIQLMIHGLKIEESEVEQRWKGGTWIDSTGPKVYCRRAKLC